MMEPAWLIEARGHIGTREIPGAKHESKILAWWRAIKRGGIKSDETPWCAAFVGACLENVGIISTRFESAASYRTWGARLGDPVVGCIAVFVRKGGGHVGFVVGRVDDGRLLILGGNQNNEVSVAPFDTARVVAYRWPKAVPIVNSVMPTLATKKPSSSNEA